MMRQAFFERGRFARRSAVVLLSVSVALVSACSSGSEGGGAPKTSAGGAKDSSIQAMLPAAVRDAGVLRVGTPIHNPPVIYKDGSKAVGMGAELITAVTDVMGLRVEYVETAFPGLFPALATHKFDVIAGVLLDDTVEREKATDMVSLGLSHAAFLVHKGNPKKLNAPSDVCGLVIGTLQGSDFEQIVTKLSQDCTSNGKAKVDLKLYPDAPTVLAQLQAGRMDAFASTDTYATYMARTAGNGNTFDISPASYPGSVYGIALQKGDADLAKAMQAAIRKAIDSGSFAKIYAKYGVQDQLLSTDEILINGATQGAFDKYRS
jgi:polar amino acid transport system substrate-binding protein